MIRSYYITNVDTAIDLNKHETKDCDTFLVLSFAVHVACDEINDKPQ